MSITNTDTFTQTFYQIIQKAYARIGVVSDENQMTTYQANMGSDILNMMLKTWIAQGIALWKIARGTLFLNPGQTSYILDGVTANATESYNSTTATATINSGSTSFSVTSATGFVIGYYIGIAQDNNTIFWTTISNVAGTTITIASATTYQATQGNPIYAYQTKINRPENIIDAQCQIEGDLEINMQLLARRTYDAIAIKNQQNIPNQLYYNKQLTYGQIELFGATPTISYLVNFAFQKQFSDMVNPLDTFDFPNEWLEPIYLNLAVRLAGFNSVKDKEFLDKLIIQAERALELVKGFDDEMGSVYFFPSSDVNRGDYL
jgi:hypothetical protein